MRLACADLLEDRTQVGKEGLGILVRVNHRTRFVRWNRSNQPRSPELGLAALNLDVMFGYAKRSDPALHTRWIIIHEDVDVRHQPRPRFRLGV